MYYFVSVNLSTKSATIMQRAKNINVNSGALNMRELPLRGKPKKKKMNENYPSK